MELAGYRGKVVDLLQKSKITIGDHIEIHTNESNYKGLLMPRYEQSNDEHVSIKLPNGYNIGLNIRKITSINKIKDGETPQFKKSNKQNTESNLPNILIISTGGTISSRIDYNTGAVHPEFTAEDLYVSIPELSEMANIDTEMISNIHSEDMSPENWSSIAEKIKDKSNKKYTGIIISHGTDTLAYTAAALSFSLLDLNIPIILVGSQRSSDRPSSDSNINIIGAVNFILKTRNKGVFIVMHSSTNDESVSIHLGARVRKNHTSKRDAFQSIDIKPIAEIKGNEITEENILLKINTGENLKNNIKFEKKVALLKFHPGFEPLIISDLKQRGYRGIILEGTGLGHVSKECYDIIQNCIKDGMIIGMTSQCVWGRVRMTVYSSGRKLLQSGVIPLENMLSETALVKLMWILGNFNENKKELLVKNLAHEITERSPLK